MNLLQQSIPQLLDPGSSGGSVQVEIQGSQTNPWKANRDTSKSVERITAIIKAGRQLREAGLSKGFQEVERQKLDKEWARSFMRLTYPS
jgi:hypothetical protein